jgi:methylglutaconyl-CoA hydratase
MTCIDTRLDGATFCVGADLKQAGQTDASATSIESSDLLLKIRRSPEPFVGRIAGHCVAGGVGLAAALDISVVADDAGFGFTEVRIGVAPAIISVVCLPKMRAAEAREAMLRGNRFDAAAAQRMGLINHAVPREQLDEVVQGIVQDLLAGGPLAIAATKQLLQQVPQMEPAAAMAWATRLSGSLFASDEGREGMAAYKEKRKASWDTQVVN